MKLDGEHSDALMRVRNRGETLPSIAPDIPEFNILKVFLLLNNINCCKMSISVLEFQTF